MKNLCSHTRHELTDMEAIGKIVMSNAVLDNRPHIQDIAQPPAWGIIVSGLMEEDDNICGTVFDSEMIDVITTTTIEPISIGWSRHDVFIVDESIVPPEVLAKLRLMHSVRRAKAALQEWIEAESFLRRALSRKDECLQEYERLSSKSEAARLMSELQ